VCVFRFQKLLAWKHRNGAELIRVHPPTSTMAAATTYILPERKGLDDLVFLDEVTEDKALAALKVR
jgi:hypothetical protein